jgi:hypothetical protein
MEVRVQDSMLISSIQFVVFSFMFHVFMCRAFLFVYRRFDNDSSLKQIYKIVCCMPVPVI